MSEIFHLRLTNYPPCDKYEMNLKILKNSQVKFGTKSLRAFGPKVKSWSKLKICEKYVVNLGFNWFTLVVYFKNSY